MCVYVFVCLCFFFLFLIFFFLLFTFNTPCSVIALAVFECILSTSHDVRTPNITVLQTESRRKHKHKQTYTNARFFTFKTCEFDPQICVYIEMEFLNLVRVKFLHSYVIWCCCCRCCCHSLVEICLRAGFHSFVLFYYLLMLFEERVASAFYAQMAHFTATHPILCHSNHSLVDVETKTTYNRHIWYA